MTRKAPDQRALEALLRNKFPFFLRKVFATLCPGQDFVPAWHLDAINWQLERIHHGGARRLITNMPPRSLKSIAVSVAFPAFVLGHDPTQRIICVSYSADLAKKHSNDFRAVLESPWYQAAFPHTRISPFKNTETEIGLTARGFRLATSVGGTLTGRGGNIIIIDDPLKADDALSETKRSGANNWFNTTLLSRLDDKRTGAILVVMQRVHMDDLTGFLLSQSDEWELLSLPAIAYHDEAIPIGPGRFHHRRAGEALSPEREPLEILEGIKQQLGSDAFSAQYQQVPVPPGGAMIKRAWVERYSELPPGLETHRTLQSWDTANKGGPDNDWSVCTTWALRGKAWYLLDVWRGRVDYPALKAQVASNAKKWRASRVLIEDMGTASALVQEVKARVSGVIAVTPDSDKISRMSVASAKFEAGEIFFPDQAQWLPDLEAELFAFPGGRYDDQCDSISQAIMYQKRSPFSCLTKEDWERAIEQARRPTAYTRKYRF
jgi:predicted phage terminase large subunit-like protein